MFSSFALSALTAVALTNADGADVARVRVRLKRALPSVAVSGYGVRVSAPTHFLTVATPPRSTVRAKISVPGRGRWLIEYGDLPTQEIQGQRLWVKGQMMHIGADAVPFDLELFAPPTGGIDVVAHLDMESYLMGVLPAEMPIAWPLQALKAQAVAARSFVWTLAHERRHRHFDVDSTIIDQVYRFVAASKGRPAWDLKLQRAVRETNGEILIDPRGRVLKAFYSADCGCTTEDPRYVWGRLDGFESVRDPTCAVRQPQRWRRRFARAEVVRRLAAGLKLARGTSLESLLVAARTPSGRVASVVAVLTKEASRVRVALNVNEFRRVFGYRRIPSSEFTLTWFGEELKVDGVGLGHGVGMCQTGAKVMAERGSTYRAILKQYYPRAEVSRGGGRCTRSSSPHPCSA